MAAKVAWQRDTWPEVRTSRPSDSKRIICDSPTVKNPSLVELTMWGTSSNGTSTTTAMTAWTRRGARYCTTGRFSTADGGTNLRRGVTRSTTKSAINGSELGKPDSQFTDTTYFFETSEAMPRARAPRNVSGMLEKAPIAAAPNASTTRNVSAMALRPMKGRTSAPERAAKVEPMIHERRRTRIGSMACIATRSGSSTTARMATPVRVNRNRA